MNPNCRLLVTVAAAIACGCSRSKPAPVASPPPATPSATLNRRTTSGAIAVNNLDAQIIAQQSLFDRTHSTAAGAALVDMYAERAQFIGVMEDYDTAYDLSVKLVEQHPDDGAAHLALASALNCLHRFKDALAECDVALAHKAEADKVQLLKAWIDGGYPQ